MIPAARFNDPANWGPALTEVVPSPIWRETLVKLGLAEPRMRLTKAGSDYFANMRSPFGGESPPMTERLRAANEALDAAREEQTAAWKEWRFGPQTEERE
jgi:hypothetical protein